MVVLPSATWLGVVFVNSIAFDGIGCSAVDGVSVDVVGKIGGVDSGAGSVEGGAIGVCVVDSGAGSEEGAGAAGVGAVDSPTA